MELLPILITVTASIGFISLCKTLVPFLWWIWVTFFRPPKNLTDYGSWALITGSTDGIGKALAFELASKGLNLVLISRDSSKLEVTSKELRDKYGNNIEVRYIVIDFYKNKSVEIVNKIEREIDGLDVGVLINNAGVAYPSPKYLHEVGLELLDSVIRVNAEGATWVTKAVLPDMLKKKKGAIVNIGSTSARFSSFPLYALYAATKAYIGMFSTSISLEYRQHGIDVQCQELLFVNTKMAPMKRSSFLVPSPEMYSRASVRCIGYEHTCMPYWTHCLQWFAIGAIPDALFDIFMLGGILRFRKTGVVQVLGFEI